MRVIFIIMITMLTLFASTNGNEEWNNIGVNKLFIPGWKKTGYTPKEVKKWISIGVSRPYNLKKWINAGYKSPKNVKKWIDIGISNPDIIKDWKRAGITTYKEIVNWKKAGIKNPIQTYEWTKIQIKDAREVGKWKRMGFDASYVHALMNQGIKTPLEFKSIHEKQEKQKNKWLDLGVSKRMIETWELTEYNTPQKAKQWIAAGIKNPFDIAYFKESNIKTPVEAKEWIKLMDPRKIQSWKVIGIKTASEVREWYKLKIYEPFSVKEWLDLGIATAKEVKAWKELNVTTAGQLKYFKDKGIRSPEELRKASAAYEHKIQSWKRVGVADHNIDNWIKIGVRTPEKAKTWKNNGFLGYGDAKDWINAGITDPSIAKLYNEADVSYNVLKNNTAISLKEIRIWRSKGIPNVMSWKNIKIETPEKAQRWINIVGNNPEYVSKIIAIGFSTPNQYLAYKHVAIKNAIKLYTWGIKPNKLIESMSYGNIIFGQELYFSNKNTFINAYNQLKSSCSEIIKDKWFSGAILNNNQCYTFVGTMMQRLDTRSGLVSGVGKRYFYAEEFKEPWLENKTKIGIIKGDGSFTYDTKNGKHVVPKGIVIFEHEL